MSAAAHLELMIDISFPTHMINEKQNNRPAIRRLLITLLLHLFRKECLYADETEGRHEKFGPGKPIFGVLADDRRIQCCTKDPIDRFSCTKLVRAKVETRLISRFGLRSYIILERCPKR